MTFGFILGLCKEFEYGQCEIVYHPGMKSKDFHPENETRKYYA